MADQTIENSKFPTLAFLCVCCGEEQDFDRLIQSYILPICDKCLKFIGEQRLLTLKNNNHDKKSN